jgi:hypothetical protein
MTAAAEFQVFIMISADLPVLRSLEGIRQAGKTADGRFAFSRMYKFLTI